MDGMSLTALEGGKMTIAAAAWSVAAFVDCCPKDATASVS
jgi:hypothetical protein